ncbi:uncharacterized protein LOC132630805 [Lycium barbarum]|uniref:uncharacterized protein LOC132630805 n=1 Tax=Lycium barbarum TaxID=112863 RepID=UPI00293E1791|nr:uncharacterized protein LOC132630805 [Lycium barbarum]
MPSPKQASCVVKKVFDARKWWNINVDWRGAMDQFVTNGKYSIKKTYGYFFPQYPNVTWRKLILIKGLIPQHQFILWLALHNKLSTVDSLTKWNIQVSTDCVMCSSGLEETHSHLLFDCLYSKFIWSTLLMWMDYTRTIGSWNEEVRWLSSLIRQTKAKTFMLGFLFAATVCVVWIERNNRRLNQLERRPQKIVREIVLQLHIVGQKHGKWTSILGRLNSFPC